MGKMWKKFSYADDSTNCVKPNDFQNLKGKTEQDYMEVITFMYAYKYPDSELWENETPCPQTKVSK